jgi:hypothetical protein
MFVKAIETAAKFTRPIHTISKPYKSNDIIPGAATIFLINDKGYAITSRHVVDLLIQSEGTSKNYNAFKAERDKLPKNGNYKRNLNELKNRFQIEDKTIVQLKITFVNCVDKMSGFTTHVHPNYDLAILKFNDFDKLNCHEFATFKKDSNEIKQGKFLCRLGFPFPEFTNFKYDDQKDEIEWTKEGIQDSPRFPIEGMVTRFLGDGKGGKFGIELSTPGLRGQSGGPLFDSNGLVCGMQSSTRHLHLGFDIENVEISTKGQKKKVSDYSFIHLGQCIHADIIKDFLIKHNVDFNEQ